MVSIIDTRLHLSGRDSVVGIARLATGWTVRGSNPGGGEIFRTRPDRPWGPPSLLYNVYRLFPGGKAAGAWCWPPTPIFSAEVLKQGRAIPLPTLTALAAYKGGTFTFTTTLRSY